MKHVVGSSRYSVFRKAGGALAGFLFAVSVANLRLEAAQATVEDRLAALESEVGQLRAENQKLRHDPGVAGTSGMIVARPAGKEPALAINGLVQVQAEFGDKGDSRGNANDRFRLRRVRLGASGRFLEDFVFKVEGEYAGSAVTLTDGFINWSRVPWANVKAGQFKTPFGYEFLAAAPKLFTIEHTLGTDRLTLSRQVGVQASGEFFDKRLGYAAGAFNGNGQNVTSNDNENFNFIGRVSGTAWDGKLFGQPAKWTVGANGFRTRDTALTLSGDFGFAGNSFTGKRYGTGIDTQLHAGPFDLWAEWLDVRFNPTNHVPAQEFDANSWYMLGTFFLVPKQLQLALRYEKFDPNDVRAGDETNTWTLGANWFIKGDDLKFQLNYDLVDVPSPAPRQRQLVLRAQTIF